MTTSLPPPVLPALDAHADRVDATLNKGTGSHPGTGSTTSPSTEAAAGLALILVLDEPFIA